MPFFLYIFLCLTLVISTGCDQKNEHPTSVGQEAVSQITLAPKSTPKTLLKDSINAVLVETATEALPIWRSYAPQKLTLVLFSNSPFLESIPAPLHDQVIQLIQSGTAEQIKAKAIDIVSDPLLLHTMAVDAAIKAGFFAELIWVLPSLDEDPLPALEGFRQKLIESGIATQTEANSLQLSGNIFKGKLRGIPVSIGNLSNIPLPTKPAMVHFDLSFFQPLYINEVRTPLYPLILKTLAKIRAVKLETVGSTISYSNLGGHLSLKIRFIGQDLSHLLKSPESLDQNIPELQFKRSQNLYLENFMKKDDILKNCLQMDKLFPDNPSVKFDIYNAYREINKGSAALEYLNQAVTLDPMYAYEYLFLAELAVEKHRQSAALNMLAKAREVFPDNPLIKIMEADIQITLEQRRSALDLIHKLQQLPWSKVYDLDMPQRLIQMEKTARALTDKG